MVHFSFDYYCA